VSGSLQFFVPGCGLVSWGIAPDATLEQVGATAGVPIVARCVTASRAGVEIRLEKSILTWIPTRVSRESTSWPDFFDRLIRGAIPNSGLEKVTLSGLLAVVVTDAWGVVYGTELAETTAPGRPSRSRRWDADREEFYALVLQQRRKPGESLRDAIDSAAKLRPEIFRRAFGGKLTRKRIEAAAQYVKRHSRDGALKKVD
jgi:hypothetical protein